MVLVRLFDYRKLLIQHLIFIFTAHSLLHISVITKSVKDSIYMSFNGCIIDVAMNKCIIYIALGNVALVLLEPYSTMISDI